jgi:four helix bundle protein
MMKSKEQMEESRGRDYSFRNLASWKKAQSLLLFLLDDVDTMPNNRVTNILVSQIVRSASSIGANIAEGHGRYAAGAYRNHLSIARGSTTETMSWLDVLLQRGYISPARSVELLGLCAEIMNLVSARMIDLDRQTKTVRSLRGKREEHVVD